MVINERLSVIFIFVLFFIKTIGFLVEELGYVFYDSCIYNLSHMMIIRCHLI